MRAGGAIVKTEGMRLAAPVQSDESGKAARRFRSLHRVVVVVCFHLVVLLLLWFAGSAIRSSR